MFGVSKYITLFVDRDYEMYDQINYLCLYIFVRTVHKLYVCK